VFFSEGIRWLYVFSFSLCLSGSVTPLSRMIARGWEVLDRPGGHKAHPSATPLLGGVPIILGFLAPLAANGVFTLELEVIAAAALVLFLLGLADDVKTVPASWKLMVQVVLSLWLAYCDIRVILFSESGSFGLWANTLVSVLWIVGITNALNFLDGMDGLAAGLGAIIAFFMAMVAYRMGGPFEGWMDLAMMGACLGFLPYNLRLGKRASIFLGDAGSTVIGFVLASLAIYTSWADLKPVVSLASPLLIFGVPIFDMCYISYFRIKEGRVHNFQEWIEYVGHDHLHHRIAAVVGGPGRSVLFIYVLAVCLGLNALLLPRAAPAEAVMILSQAVLIFILVSILERKGRTLAEQNGRIPVSPMRDKPSSPPGSDS